MPLIDSDGNKIVIKAFGVDHILAEKIGRDQVNFNGDEFPDVSSTVLAEVGKALPKKYLDILMGNSNLGLQPVCNYGFGCQNCYRGRCLYRSRFADGYIPLGNFSNNKDVNTGLKHVVIAKLSPPISGALNDETTVKLTVDNVKNVEEEISLTGGGKNVYTDGSSVHNDGYKNIHTGGYNKKTTAGFQSQSTSGCKSVPTESLRLHLISSLESHPTGFSKLSSSKKFSASSSSSVGSSSSSSSSRRKSQRKTSSTNFKLSQEETSSLESHPTGYSNSARKSQWKTSSIFKGSHRQTPAYISQDTSLGKSQSTLESPPIGFSNSSKGSSSSGSLRLSSTNICQGTSNNSSRRKCSAGSPSSGSLKSSSMSSSEGSSLPSSSFGSLSQEGTSIKSLSKVSTSSLESHPTGSSKSSPIGSSSLSSSSGSLTMSSIKLSRRKVMAASTLSERKS